MRSPVTDLKAIKNDAEVAGFRASHVRDGAALVRYFAWLEEQLDAGKERPESEVAGQLEKYRAEGQHFKGLSFPTISATGPNGGASSVGLSLFSCVDTRCIAIIHYEPVPGSDDIVRKDQVRMHVRYWILATLTLP